MGELVNMDVNVRLIEDELCLSAGMMREIFGVSAQALSEWVSKGMPRAAHGWYPLKRVLAWKGRVRMNGEPDGGVDLARRKIEVEIALKESQQELTQLKTDVANGKYLERELVTEEYRRFFVVLKRAMLAIPRRVAGVAATHIDPVEARRLEKELNDIVTDALESFVKAGVIDA